MGPVNSRILYLIDSDKHLLDVFTAGSVIAYVSMLFNILVFLLLCRKALRSPATVLMQGLAVADFLTAFSSYGLHPLFLLEYDCEYSTTRTLYECFLQHPYCSLATHLSISFFTFHNISFMITTCLGLQKVIAIRYPIWTKNQLTINKTAIICVFFFVLSVALGMPRHFAIKLEADISMHRQICIGSINDKDVIKYASVHYLMFQTTLMTCCCFVMVISTFFIIYKLINNKFKGRVTERRRQERRSVIMIVIVLVVFLITEIPKVILNLWWCIKHTAGDFLANDRFRSLLLLQNYEDEMSKLLIDHTDMISGYYWYRYSVFRFLLEIIKLFTLLGCLSNFIIYIIMSMKLRNEIISLFKKTPNGRALEMEMNRK
ncbi:CMKLR1 [Mytilus edulis]|uniref:CMKLR1 n=1 Tax=Mytilus edulis TaxID=6550 RepID=A0A8S3UVH3_MYTED|nr:CMKLR1 [Mytilus edulis]